MAERILLTGATGRVARQLLPGLRGAWEVRGLDRARGEGTADVPEDLVVGELTDATVLERALGGVAAVVHLAGNPEPSARWQELADPNVDGFVALLAACTRAGVRRVVFASSVHAMGGYEGSRRWPVEAGWPPSPCCAYGASKAFDEALARAYAYRSDLTLVGLRLGLTTPSATPARARAGWLAPLDLRDLVAGALTADVRVGIYPGISWPGQERWDISTAVEDLGYRPARDLAPTEDGDDGEVLLTCDPSGRAPHELVAGLRGQDRA